MYVVRRAFRNNGYMIAPGSIVEPGATKLFKTRVRDRQIIEVTSDNYDVWREYFLGKFGVELAPIKRRPAEQVKCVPVKIK